MIGTEVERQGIIRHGAKMVTAVSEATVPKVSVVVRKAYGAGLYAMSGPAFEPEATIALPTAKIAVMGPEAAVNAVFANKIAAIEDPDERAAFVAEQRTLYEEDVDLYRLASELVIDAVVDFPDLRHEVVQRLALATGQGPPLLRPPPRRTARVVEPEPEVRTRAGRRVGWRPASAHGRLSLVPLPSLPTAVVIRDVGPRDGLQPEAPVSVADRVRLIEALVAAGVARIEAAAFVSPAAVPGDGRRGRGAGRGTALRFGAVRRPGAQRAGRRAGARLRRRRAHRHDLALGDLQPAQRPHVDGRVGRRHRGDLSRGGCVCPWTRCSAARSARPTKGTSHPARCETSRTVCGKPGAPPSRARTPPAWPRPAGSPRCSRWSVPTSGSTCTRPEAPPWCARTPPCSSGWRGSTPRSAGSAGRRSRPAPPATSPPRSWWRSSTTSGCTPASTSRRSSRRPPWPVSWSAGPSRVGSRSPVPALA